MQSRRSFWSLSAFALVLGLMPATSAAQPARPSDAGFALPDPHRFPALANNRLFQEAEWAFTQRADQHGVIPSGAKQRALAQIASAERATQVGGAGGRLSAPTTAWSSIGPAPILGGQTPGARPVSGRLTSVTTDPTDPAHWIVGAAQGGAWETHDAGQIWGPLTDDQVSLAVGAVAIAPSSPSTLYVGTGEANYSGDSYYGAGLLKSTDGGGSWQLLGASLFTQASFSAIEIDPATANTVLASTTRGFAGRASTFPPALPLRGVFRSLDGGSTWTRTLTGETTDLKANPTNFAQQYAGIGDVFGSAQNGVYRSLDGGQTWGSISGPWSGLPAGVGRVALAISPSNPNIAFVAIQDSFNQIGSDGALLGLWQTTSAWAASPSWTQIFSTPGFCGTQCWYDLVLSVDPTNSSVLYAGGIPLWKFDGVNWTNVGSSGQGIHTDQHGLAWAGSRLVVANDGGAWSTSDGGTTWNDHNTGLADVQFYNGSVGPANSLFALGGTQDNGTEKWTGDPAWNLVYGGDGGFNAISSASPDSNWAVSFQQLGIVRTTNGGASFITADAGINKASVAFIAPLKKCPNGDDIFIAGTGSVWRSNNFFSAPSPTWANNSPSFGTITALAFAPSDSTCNTYVVGMQSGQIRLTTNGGASWSDLDPSNAVPNRAVTGLAFDPVTATTLFVTLSGFDQGTPGQPGHAFKTINALTSPPTWSNVTPPVNIPFDAVLVDPNTAGTVYVGTDLGIWVSVDGGTSWIHMGAGMPNVAVYDLQASAPSTRIFAFTHGRGAFTLGTSTSGTPPVIDSRPAKE